MGCYDQQKNLRIKNPFGFNGKVYVKNKFRKGWEKSIIDITELANKYNV